MQSEIKRLDHVNLRTGQLEAMIAWYRDMLGLTLGPRPDFDFPGAWLYAGDHALVHLIETTPPPEDDHADLTLEHFAFSAVGLEEMLGKMESNGTRTMLRRVPGFPIMQLNAWDPDGNHLHIDFDVAEADAMGLP